VPLLEREGLKLDGRDLGVPRRDLRLALSARRVVAAAKERGPGRSKHPAQHEIDGLGGCAARGSEHYGRTVEAAASCQTTDDMSRVRRDLPERDLGEKNVGAGGEIEALNHPHAFPDLHGSDRRAREAGCSAVGTSRALRALRPLGAVRAGKTLGTLGAISTIGTRRSLLTLGAISTIGTRRSLLTLGAISTIGTRRSLLTLGAVSTGSTVRTGGASGTWRSLQALGTLHAVGACGAIGALGTLRSSSTGLIPVERSFTGRAFSGVVDDSNAPVSGVVAGVDHPVRIGNLGERDRSPERSQGDDDREKGDSRDAIPHDTP
jgi:hypothetical protein